ncbi:MAG: AmmeMemoRadiSam system radical SAM enzyme [Candidatus Aenigmatarchaeota archaeon]
MHKAVLFDKKSSRCLACSHYCIINKGKTGICSVRKNVNGKLFLLVYGRAIAVNIDPIEKKPLFHFMPGSNIFSIGTIGCNFACSFCQNWDISQASKEIGKDITKLGKRLEPEKIVNICLERGIPAIAYTYNEPAIFFEYAYDTAKLAHKHGIKNVFVSNGYESKEAIKKIKPYLDAINIDLKSFSNDFYTKICKAQMQPVLDGIKRMHDAKIWLEITTLVIPGKNDSNEELKKSAEFIAGIDKSIPWHVSRFFPHFKMSDIKPTPAETLERAYEIGKAAGLKYVYIGNMPDKEYESTYCPECNSTVIERSGFIIGKINMKNGKCKKCGCKIEGVWE